VTVEEAKEEATVSDVIRSRKRQLEGATQEEGSLRIRKDSGDTEDLEDDGKKLYSFKSKQ